MKMPSLSPNQRMLASAVALAACLAIIGIGIALAEFKVRESSAVEAAEAQVAQHALAIARDVSEIQSTVRGYALTGDADSLSVYRNANVELQRKIGLMLDVENRGRDYYDRLHALQRIYENFQAAHIEPMLELRQTYEANLASFDDIEAHYRNRSGIDLSRQIRTTVDAILASEEERGVFLQNATNTAKQHAQERLTLTGIMGLIMSLMVCVSLFRVGRINQKTAEVCSQLANGDISVRLQENGKSDYVSMAVNAMISSLREAVSAANQIAAGDLEVNIQVHNEEDQLGVALRNMTDILRQGRSDNLKRTWYETGMAEFSQSIRGDEAIADRGKHTLGVVVRQLGAQVGTFFIPSKDGKTLHLVASHAFTHRHSVGDTIDTQSGLLGQAIAEGEIVVVRRVPADYLVIASGLGETAPRQVMLVPIVFEGELMGALELATLGEFSEDHVQWVRGILEPLGVVLQSAKDRNRVRSLLAKSQAQARQLAEQQEELRASNEELSEQTERLRSSEEELRTQSDSLQALNAELEEKNESLDRQKDAIAQKNSTLELIRIDLEERSKQLEISGKYKSEFLANMSHELRTPLNSLLLLSRSLLDNDTGNLDAEQLESLDIIHKGGKDLLTLINDILDLSKVESGKLSVLREEIRISDIADSMRSQFRKVAQDKKIDFQVDIGALRDTVFFSDTQRVEQILKNLLSNAHKFTLEGTVTLSIDLKDHELAGSDGGVSVAPCIQFAVRDTGIGIAPDKLRDVWEAFQQADGTTSRNFGGTGLGLTISRQLAALLGGSIQLESELGKGSVFSLLLPLDGLEGCATVEESHAPSPSILCEIPSALYAKPQSHLNGKHHPPNTVSNVCQDDRDNTDEGQSNLLIIEDDMDFARVLLGRARKRSFKGLVGSSGAEGLELARRFLPKGVVLDLGLPDMDGMQVLEQLKRDLRTRHIPVHIVSGRDKDTQMMAQGAVGYLKKPITAESITQVFDSISRLSGGASRQLLIVEDDAGAEVALHKLLNNPQTTIVVARSGGEALDACTAGEFDCIILDLGLPDMTGEQFLQKLEAVKGELPPVIVYTGQNLTEEEYRNLQQYSGSVVVKGVHSPERLLDEVSLFLHTVESGMPLRQRQKLQEIHGGSELLNGKKVLLVDDDVRNTFALSKMLTKQGMKVIMADDGKLAIEKLLATPDVDIVLMDIMMPVMDGYEAMEAIRQKSEYRDLPIIALTAKAMNEDRKKCLDAGASDYLTKPVDIDRLTSIMRVWLSNQV